jgi:hypothetical protein
VKDEKAGIQREGDVVGFSVGYTELENDELIGYELLL